MTLKLLALLIISAGNVDVASSGRGQLVKDLNVIPAHEENFLG